MAERSHRQPWLTLILTLTLTLTLTPTLTLTLTLTLALTITITAPSARAAPPAARPRGRRARPPPDLRSHSPPLGTARRRTCARLRCQGKVRQARRGCTAGGSFLTPAGLRSLPVLNRGRILTGGNNEPAWVYGGRAAASWWTRWDQAALRLRYAYTSRTRLARVGRAHNTEAPGRTCQLRRLRAARKAARSSHRRASVGMTTAPTVRSAALSCQNEEGRIALAVLSIAPAVLSSARRAARRGIVASAVVVRVRGGALLRGRHRWEGTSSGRGLARFFLHTSNRDVESLEGSANHTSALDLA